jgi:hypothetical protein
MLRTDAVYAVFGSHTDGMRFHESLVRAGIPHDICPTPRDLDASCGIALRFHADVAGAVERIANECPVPVRVLRRSRMTNTDGGDAGKGA